MKNLTSMPASDFCLTHGLDSDSFYRHANNGDFLVTIKDNMQYYVILNRLSRSFSEGHCLNEMLSMLSNSVRLKWTYTTDNEESTGVSLLSHKGGVFIVRTDTPGKFPLVFNSYFRANNYFEFLASRRSQVIYNKDFFTEDEVEEERKNDKHSRVHTLE